MHHSINTIEGRRGNGGQRACAPFGLKWEWNDRGGFRCTSQSAHLVTSRQGGGQNIGSDKSGAAGEEEPHLKLMNMSINPLPDRMRFPLQSFGAERAETAIIFAEQSKFTCNTN
jgi:hypothetical protein